MKTEVEIETALYSILQDAPIETVVRCLGKVCYDVEQQLKHDRESNAGTWALYGDQLHKLAD